MAGPTYFEAAINIAKNEDWVVPFQYGYYDTDGVTVIPIDLTGSVIKMEIRIQETDREALVSVFTPDNGIVFDSDDPTAGRFTITILRFIINLLFIHNNMSLLNLRKNNGQGAGGAIVATGSRSRNFRWLTGSGTGSRTGSGIIPQTQHRLPAAAKSPIENTRWLWFSIR